MEHSNTNFLWLDGGVGTSLGDDTPGLSWVPTAALIRPEAVRRVHAAFLQSGCTALTTATYACTPRITQLYLSMAQRCPPERQQLCAQLGLNLNVELAGANALLAESLAAHEAYVSNGNKSEDFWLHCARAGAKVALAAAAESGTTIEVVASCPPLRDSYDFQDADVGEAPFYAQLAKAMREEGVEIFLLETVPNLITAERTLPILWAARPREVWVSFVPRTGSSGKVCTLAGELLVAGVLRLPPAAVPSRFLCNCGSLQSCFLAVQELAAAGLPCGACPNVNATDACLDHAPFSLSDLVQSWLCNDDEEDEDEHVDTDDGDDMSAQVRDGQRVGDFLQQAAQVGGSKLCVMGGCCTVSPSVLMCARSRAPRDATDQNSH